MNTCLDVVILSLSSSVSYPFAELPQSLVKEMLEQSNGLSRDLSTSFKSIINQKDEFREKLEDFNFLQNESELNFDKIYPTTCGIDGSFIIENLLSVDVLAVAGVAVEGLSPPTEVKHWPCPRHISKILTLAHSDSSRQVAGALMMCMELELALKAPHEVVFLDGSLSTPYVHFSKAINVIDKVPINLRDEFLQRFQQAIANYHHILHSSENRIYVGVPKYTTKKEICSLLNLKNYEDRGVLSFILEEGEFIIPNKMASPYGDTDTGSTEYYNTLKKTDDILNDLYVIYYRPSKYFPVIRLELMGSVAQDSRKLSILFETLKMQCNAPGMFEPFPLYLADRMVKHLRVALPALRKAATQSITRDWDGEISNLYLAMHGYRSKWG